MKTKTRKAVRAVVWIAAGAGVLLAGAGLVLAIRDATHRPLPAVGVPRDALRGKGGV